MSTLTLFALLRAIHIVAGAAWVGAVLFTGRFLIPTVQALGPAGGQLMQHLTQVRRLPAYMIGVALTNVVSGLALYGMDSSASSGRWATSHQGMIFGLGGLLAIITLILGLTINSPAAKRMGSLAGSIQAAGRAPTESERAELGRLQTRITLASRIGVVLLVTATVMMAVARYVP